MIQYKGTIHERCISVSPFSTPLHPVIAKPDDGVGAIGTYRLNGNQDLDAFFETKPDTDYIMEEFIAGSIIGRI